MRVALLLAALLAPAALASTDAEPRVARLFPPEDVPWGDVPALVAERLGIEPEYVLGDAPMYVGEASRVRDGTYKVTVTASRPDGNFDPAWSVEQRVHREDGTLRLVRPEDLRVAVELRGRVTVTAPPGVLPGEGRAPAEAAEATARRLGLPEVDAGAWNVTTYAASLAPRPLLLYGPAFPYPPHFSLDCDACVLAERKLHPLDTVNVNYALAYVAPDGSVVAFEASDFVDVHDPRILPLDEAERRARGAMERDGLRVASMTFHGHALTDERFAYKWSASLRNGSRDGWTHALAEQDALTGRLLASPYTTATSTGAGEHVQEAPPPARETPLPALAIVAAFLGAVLARRR